MNNNRMSYDLNIDKVNVGKRIRGIRLANQLTLGEFGEQLGGVSKGAVAHWENGKNLPNKNRLIQIADMGDQTLDQLLYGVFKKNTGCKYCNQEEMILDLDKFHPLDINIFDNIMYLDWESDMCSLEINFCPMCGVD